MEQPTELNCYKDTSATITDENKVVIYDKQASDVFPKKLNCKEHEYLRLELAAGMTLNIGNFQFLRIDAKLNVPTEADPVELEKTFNQTKAWLSTAIQALKEEAMRAQ